MCMKLAWLDFMGLFYSLGKQGPYGPHIIGQALLDSQASLLIWASKHLKKFAPQSDPLPDSAVDINSKKMT